MGDVFLARHEIQGNLVAIKRVRDVESLQLASLRREIHALSRLRHPGVVRLVDHGTFEGLPWCALEFVDGETMQAALLSPRPHEPGHRPATTAATQAPSEETAVVTTDATSRVERIPFLAAPSMPGGDPAPAAVVSACLAAVKKLCEPLAFLHGEGIVHCDLKP